MERTRKILPGGCIGMLGGGQLGRMSLLAGRRLGYRFRVYDPQPGGPAAVVAESEMNGRFDDLDRLYCFGEGLDVATLEFENVSEAAVRAVERSAPVHPSAEVLALCQNRAREKDFLRKNGFPCAPFAVVASEAELRAAVAEIGFPCVVKTAAFGYDGKGQRKVSEESQIGAAWEALGGQKLVVEKWVTFEGEFSVICARNAFGAEAVFPLAENIHRDHILHTTIAPARLSEKAAAEAFDLAKTIAEAIGLVGVLAVELFHTAHGWVVNELAPRPHNSGHFSFDACLTSQFEQHIRAVCGLPLGATDLLRPTVMVNLLGDLWAGGEPRWERILAEPRAKLHLYGKSEARPGRKMGHFCVLEDNVESALALARHLESALKDS
jgi:5-(carboxyamino)imidazole ribonucleotide synthase